MTDEYVPVAIAWVWHPKVIGLSSAARGIWISGLCYAGANGGIVPFAAIPQLSSDLKPTQRQQQIDALIASELWEVIEGGYRVHDFDEHCAWLSDRRARDRERQKKRRDRLSTSRSRHVTERDASVTVTPEREQGTMNSEQERLTPKPPRGDVAFVWSAWLESTGRTGCKLDDKRRRVITARLAEFPLDDVVDAVRGWERDPWPGRREQNEIKILLRDAAQVEKFRDLWRRPKTVQPQFSENPIDRRIRENTERDRGWRPSTVIDMRVAHA